MKTVLFTFWRCSWPYRVILIGLLGLVLIPSLPSLPDDLQYLTGISLLGVILPAGIFLCVAGWDFGLDLPLSRRRLFDLRVLAGFLAALVEHRLSRLSIGEVR